MKNQNKKSWVTAIEAQNLFKETKKLAKTLISFLPDHTNQTSVAQKSAEAMMIIEKILLTELEIFWNKKTMRK